ncbi:MAG: 16S rRNA (guanine(527)-N(7))-methyltransferase RsmG [Kiloniellales bacterium]
MTVEAFQDATRVSRETLERLKVYAELLVKWNGSINLVGAKSLDDLWGRHMLDSAQLQPLLPPKPPERSLVIVDLGTGAGFPGMVLSILGAGEVHLIESDQRKVQFLREVARNVGSEAHIHGVRIEELRPFPADVVTARALAPLDKLLQHAAPYLEGGGYALFLKGRRARQELTEAEKAWKMQADCIPSRSDPSGTILHVGDISARETSGHGMV